MPGHISALAAAAVSVFPLAGTPDVSPRTQISVRGVPAAQIASVIVRGSKTGRHSGRLVASSDGSGASFIPSRRFAAGERVSVRVAGSTAKFTIARSPGRLKTQRDVRDPGGAAPGAQSFQTQPGLHPPDVRIDTPGGDGYVFVAPKNGPGDDGPMIVDPQGRTVWFKRMPSGIKAFDFREQQYQGRPVLTWWQGLATGGKGFGDGMVYDTSYRQVARVRAGNGYRADLHEFLLTPQGTAFVIAYPAVRIGRTPVLDSVIQEVDVKTGLVVFEWHGLGHVSLRESYARRSRGYAYDYLHANSVDLEPNGNLLVSARNTSAIYEIDHRSGAVLHRYGGRRSDFRLAAGTRFIGQHDARLLADGTISVFDNASTSGRVLPSRALVLRPDLSGRTLSVVHAYRHPRGLGANSQGNVQVLPGGDTFVGWGGSIPYFTQFSSQGQVDFEGHFVPTRNETYRAYRAPWQGRPGGRPDVAARGTTVWASWNGATDVASWQVLAGTSPDALSPVANAPWTGFETAIPLGSAQPWIQVRALDASGAVLGTSQAVRPSA
ncbi:MAG: arylsulfotransferase family protein [Thermoleophilaceae bacterium]